MRFEESKYFSLLPHSKIEFSFGTYYLCENFVIAEIDESVHFDWDKILEVIGALLDYYGENLSIGYVSNRIQSYSVEPHLWIRFHKEFDFIIATAIVSYNNFASIGVGFEKQFIKRSLQACADLHSAISWTRNEIWINQN